MPAAASRLAVLRAAAVTAIAAALAGGVIVGPAAPASAAPGAACTSSFYWARNSQLNTVALGAGGTASLTPIGAPAVGNYNALGYNTEDGYLYALGTSAGVNQAHLLKVSDDGSTTDLGIPAGLPVASYVEGDFDQNGVLWVSTIGGFTPGNALYGIDVATGTATLLTLQQSIRSANDFAYYDGKLYTTTSGAQPSSVVAIDTTTGAVSISSPMGVALAGSPALFSTSSGHLYVYYAGGGGAFYEVLGFTTATPSLLQVATGMGSVPGDGASCYSAASPFLAATDDDETSTPLPVGGGTLTGILDNDRIRGNIVTGSAVTTTLLADGGLTGAALDAFGTLDVPAGAAGIYTLTYRICDVTTPALCDDAVITVALVAATAAVAADPALPPTGTPVPWWTPTGAAALIVAGALLAVLPRRRWAARRRRA